MSKIQEIVDSPDVAFGVDLTLKVSFVVPKGYTDMSPEDLFKEWFSDKHPLHVRTNGHAFRDGSLVGNSDEVLSYDIIKKTVNDK
jgi:hypothetical protein